MATANRTTKAPASSQRLLTAADLTALPDQLPSGPVKYELDHGHLIVMTPPGDEHAALQAKLSAEFINQGQQPGHGKARGEVSVLLGRSPDWVLAPDAAFIAKESLPLRRTKEGFLETVPDLVVEIRSKNETNPEVLAKVRDYLKAGARVVWVADPKKQTVTAHRPKGKPQVFAARDTLTVEDVIPGFRLSVAELFRD